MRYPSKKTLKEMDRKLKGAEGTLMVGPSSSPAEKFRWELCQILVKYMTEKNLSQVEFAKLLGIDQSRISEIVNHRIDKVSTDKLIAYNEKINPKVEFRIAR
ncbi:MAG: XRE family transcriptional regulator [Bdellovibrionaceae bacterium]|nr:XRE family transcriptional regulator [Bdellovibrionales bacterium]MCB9083776.1 XRE family transcriptional regulator [Pseudobdellovibrionaceae bacterium]